MFEIIFKQILRLLEATDETLKMQLISNIVSLQSMNYI